jgi:hypothetical protein
MKQRIKQLIEQAEIKFESHPQHQGIDTAVIIPTDLEKFAELIVQKCADIGERYADGNYEVPNQILEYFGMEEE